MYLKILDSVGTVVEFGVFPRFESATLTQACLFCLFELEA